MSLNCIVIGAGNLATHLAIGLKQIGFKIGQVYNRTEKSAKELANKLDTAYTNNPEKIFPDADIYFIAVRDDAFSSLLPQINFNNKLVVHCAGSMPLSVLRECSENTGVF